MPEPRSAAGGWGKRHSRSVCAYTCPEWLISAMYSPSFSRAVPTWSRARSCAGFISAANCAPAAANGLSSPSCQLWPCEAGLKTYFPCSFAPCPKTVSLVATTLERTSSYVATAARVSVRIDFSVVRMAPRSIFRSPDGSVSPCAAVPLSEGIFFGSSLKEGGSPQATLSVGTRPLRSLPWSGPGSPDSSPPSAGGSGVVSWFEAIGSVTVSPSAFSRAPCGPSVGRRGVRGAGPGTSDRSTTYEMNCHHSCGHA